MSFPRYRSTVFTALCFLITNMQPCSLHLECTFQSGVPPHCCQAPEIQPTASQVALGSVNGDRPVLECGLMGTYYVPSSLYSQSPITLLPLIDRQLVGNTVRRVDCQRSPMLNVSSDENPDTSMSCISQ